MKILFTTAITEAASTQLNIQKLRLLNNLPDIQIDFFRSDYQNYDVVLFMGYDPDIENARAQKPDVKIGVIDPRPPAINQPVGADFILANGIEMKDWYMKFTHNIFNYHIYPVLNGTHSQLKTTDKIIIGYHGNKIHLEEMNSRISDALTQLAQFENFEFWAVYDVLHLGKWNSNLLETRGIHVEHIQWHENVYDEVLAKVDIGIIPNLIPVDSKSKSIVSKNRIYNEDDTDYMIRYKATSNAGRVLVFAQLGIPVICDMFPSSLQMIQDGEDGLICHSTESWFYSLLFLVKNSNKRKTMGSALKEKFNNKYHQTIQNEALIEFIRNINSNEFNATNQRYHLANKRSPSKIKNVISKISRKFK